MNTKKFEAVVRRTYQFEAGFATLEIDSHMDGETLTLAKVEEVYIRHVLQITGSNKTRAAKLLGVDRRTLYRRLRKIAEHDDEGWVKALESRAEGGA